MFILIIHVILDFSLLSYKSIKVSISDKIKLLGM